MKGVTTHTNPICPLSSNRKGFLSPANAGLFYMDEQYRGQRGRIKAKRRFAIKEGKGRKARYWATFEWLMAQPFENGTRYREEPSSEAIEGYQLTTLAMVAQGMTYHQIAEKIGVSRSVVRTFVRKQCNFERQISWKSKTDEAQIESAHIAIRDQYRKDRKWLKAQDQHWANHIEVTRWNARKYYLIPHNRIASSLRTVLRLSLRKRFTKSDIVISNLIGCSVRELVEYLESQFTPKMNWDNYGSYWHIDHIMPCASFDLTDPDQQKVCFNWQNLQPLEARKNIIKSNKIIHPQLQIPLVLS